jgi:hypothetical protein
MQLSLRSARAIQILFGLFLATSAAAEAPDYIFGDGFESSPILWYPFEGDSTNTGSLSGYALSLSNATYDAGKFGQAISFGTNGSASVTGMKSVLGVLPRVTIGFWIYESAIADRDYWDVGNRSTVPYGGVTFYENSNSTIAVCVSTAFDLYVTGSCPFFGSPTTGMWHHWIIMYAGTGTGVGQGGPVSVYLDDVLQLTIANDVSNDPVFNPGISDTLYIGGNDAPVDDLRIYDRVFTPAE